MGTLGEPAVKTDALTARKAGLIGCSVCHLLSPAPAPGAAARVAQCPSCGAALHSRKPDSIARTWALVIAAVGWRLSSNGGVPAY
jgi:paraquat-inducible protein A